MTRIALGIEYDGTPYCGWQRQFHGFSVQQQLEEALEKVAQHPISVRCAGRTDASVHALGQVIHFDTKAIRPLKAWMLGVNSYLPAQVRVIWVKEMDTLFDARRSALKRRYTYLILNRAVNSAVLKNKVAWIRVPLEIEWMQQAAQALIGQHDFNAFRSTQCQAKTSIRTIHHLEIKKQNDLILLDISANAFLHHMVRNIAGSLIMVGRGVQQPQWLKTVLESKNRQEAGFMAPGEGLYLTEVTYPLELELPKNPCPAWFESL